ncbi:MAG: hypothetical protein WAX69_15300 [Victivallales bacterium]
MKEISDEKIKDLHSYAMRLAFERQVLRARGDKGVNGTKTILDDINFLRSFENTDKIDFFMKYLKEQAPELAKEIAEREGKDKGFCRGVLTRTGV